MDVTRKNHGVRNKSFIFKKNSTNFSNECSDVLAWKGMGGGTRSDWRGWECGGGGSPIRRKQEEALVAKKLGVFFSTMVN